MFLEIECVKCKVASTCPRNGSSPFLSAGGKKLLCRIIGGYGKQPVDPSILSDESKLRSEKDGPCLTIAEVPTDEDGHLIFRPVTIFSQPITHPREKTDWHMDAIIPKSPS